MKYLSPVDAAFLRMESLRTPMHVGSLMTFKLPKDAPPDFLQNLLQIMREKPFMPEPFDCKLAQGRFSKLAPAWVPADIDIDYHVRHSALPYPGGERELGILVARLHSHPMDLSRPLWECHIIEGLENNRFGLYFKAHHCAIDGMGAMSMVKHWLSADPNDRNGPGVMQLPKREKPRKSAGRKLRDATSVARDNARAITELGRKMSEIARSGEHNTIRASRHTPRSLFNVHTSQQRRLGTQILELARVKAVSKAVGVSVNDTILAICGGAMRRYLLENDALPETSLNASVPVAVPRTDGQGTAVVGFVAPMGTTMADPIERMRHTHAVTTQTKDQLLAMSSTAQNQFTLMGLSPLIIGQMTGQLAKWPPFFNVTVSNVVLTKHKLYLMGAELEAMYPMSILFDGYALNVTIIGYGEHVTIGFIGCRDAIPSLQRLAVYTTDALLEIEKALGIQPPPVPAEVTAKLPAAAAKPATKKAGAKKAASKKPASRTAKRPATPKAPRTAAAKSSARKTPSVRKKKA